LAAEGYETVFCGRMHFKGEDQRHGFTKRIMDDITVNMWGKRQDFGEELGPFNKTLGMGGCLDLIGGGNSPVLEYDRKVTEAALNYLDQDHEKPQFLVVGTYGPHFPYVAPLDLYEYYQEKVELPHTMKNDINYNQPIIASKEQKVRNSVLSGKKEKVNKEIILKARAAYYGMITQLDKQIGQVKQKWDEYLNNNQKKGIFIYTSDHGDTAGENNIFGKQTFYEGSARIPLIFEGDGIKADNRIESPVSIMDIGLTLCELTDAVNPPQPDGKSLLKEISQSKIDEERVAICEFIERYEDKIVPGRMLRKDKWKLISYANYNECDLLFNLDDDPHELNNVIEKYPEKVKELRDLIYEDWDIENVIENYRYKKKNQEILNKWGETADYQEKERWRIPVEITEIDESNFI
ncbi:MAG: sulfatase-like hydrolase/transferase, partial [bacterium]